MFHPSLTHIYTIIVDSRAYKYGGLINLTNLINLEITVIMEILYFIKRILD